VAGGAKKVILREYAYLLGFLREKELFFTILTFSQGVPECE
jgi:hypothetical protein